VLDCFSSLEKSHSARQVPLFWRQPGDRALPRVLQDIYKILTYQVHKWNYENNISSKNDESGRGLE
jgi:hypothetical protein